MHSLLRPMRGKKGIPRTTFTRAKTAANQNKTRRDSVLQSRRKPLVFNKACSNSFVIWSLPTCKKSSVKTLSAHHQGLQLSSPHHLNICHHPVFSTLGSFVDDGEMMIFLNKIKLELLRSCSIRQR